MAPTGNVVSLAHKAAMQSSFPLLKKNYKFSKVLFFGKVMGKVVGVAFALVVASQFHLTFYVSRTLPNTYGGVLAALRGRRRAER